VGIERGPGDEGRRPTKAERKERSRLEREAIQAQAAARRRTRTIGLVVGPVVLVGFVAVIALTADGDGASGTDRASEELPGMLLTEAPWPANTDELAARLDVLDLPAEGVAQHLHVPLYVYVDGEAVTVPTNLGISASAVSPLHTHDELGTLHVESAAVQDFTLGQAFDVWGVRLDADCLGGYCGSGDVQLRVFSGGQEVAGDPRAVVLEDTSAVVVTFGTEDDLPDPVPTGFPSAAAEG
jgi:hypothetical protein